MPHKYHRHRMNGMNSKTKIFEAKGLEFINRKFIDCVFLIEYIYVCLIYPFLFLSS